MTDTPTSTAPAAAAHPLVKGRCPACNGSSLFLGSGGYVTCARLDCPNPCAADDLLHRGKPAPGRWLTEGSRDVRIPVLAAQHSSPREHCGELQPALIGSLSRTECVLRPGHSGSHADDRGCRWWEDPGAEQAERTTPNNPTTSKEQ